VLVVGGGPAGIAAAASAAASAVTGRVLLVDDYPTIASTVDGVRVLTRTTAFGYYDDNYVVAVERRTNHLGAAAPAHVAIWRSGW
jgi:sarcosine oxidase subunit alpha